MLLRCLQASVLSSWGVAGKKYKGREKSSLAARHLCSYKPLLTAVMNQSKRHINNDTKRHIYC